MRFFKNFMLAMNSFAIHHCTSGLKSQLNDTHFTLKMQVRLADFALSHQDKRDDIGTQAFFSCESLNFLYNG